MQQNMVSIIVPVYNAGNYIEETIRMVEAQTYQDWELLLIDDCSVDNSRAVIEAYIRERGQKLSSEEQKKKEIRLIRRTENGGAARTRNTGIAEAQGRYIAFLDADDIWMPDKLTREVEFLQKSRQHLYLPRMNSGMNRRGVRGRSYMPRNSLLMRRHCQEQ